MVNITRISPKTFESKGYNAKDVGLVANFSIDSILSDISYIEFFVFSPTKQLLNSNLNYLGYKIIDSNPDEITNFQIYPDEDLKKLGYDEGSTIAYYNFLNNRIGNSSNNLFISEISSDRTEIRLDSNILSSLDIIEQTNNFIRYREEQPYFVDFYLNLGGNNLYIANNIKLEDEDLLNPTILIKLYKPLPLNIDLKSNLWIVTTLNEPEAFQVDVQEEPIEVIDTINILGPNFSLPLKNEVNNSSLNLSYNDIINGTSTGSFNQIQGILSSSNININIDYTDFNKFIHFSSAKTRLENFKYKIGLLEQYSSSIDQLQSITSSVDSLNILEEKTSNIIQNFDGYEKFLYYESSSFTWPKTTSVKPYELAKENSTEVLNWLGSTTEGGTYFGGQLLSASNFDNANPDELKKSIPEYLREDPANQPYDLFVDMVAQYYDNVWLYTKDITQKYNADNRLDFGVSKDLVSDAIKDFGIKLYQNNFSNQELYTAFLGMTPNGSLFPFPEITGSLPAPTGFEFVDTLISASNDVISMDDTNKSLYKRIYHNIPYLLKSKGTISGLRALITSYGIPDTILKISEFGGKDQVNANDYDLYFNNFNYAFNATDNFITSSWEVDSDWNASGNVPSTVQLRFKSEEFPPTNLSQSLWQIKGGTNTAELLLDYTGSGLISGSHSGSIKDPNYQYANLRFIPNYSFPNISASISLPFYNGDWWSVMITTDKSGTYNLYAGNKIYNGNDGTSIGYYDSNSITGASDARWTNGDNSIFASSSLNFPSYEPFSGSLQEIRYYTQQISESVFKDYIMNPLSFEGNGVNSAPDQLIFRAALGSELDIITSSSIHPQVTGSWITTSSFANDSDFYFNSTPSYSKNTEYFFLDQPAVGIKNRTTDKIRSENDIIPSGNTLSPIRRLSQNTEASASYTDNVNYLEVAFSPQNQINDDIIGQMGHFNIGDYIGDPRQRFSGSLYPDLNNLSEDYFKKYIKQYDLVDFVRLIKFFDNSLFKMIKDFIPVKTSLASGLVVKQHLLERNKYKQPKIQPPINELLTSSITMGSISGSTGGMFNPYNNSFNFTTTTITPIYSASYNEFPFDQPFTSFSQNLDLRSSNFQTNAPGIDFFTSYINTSNPNSVPNLWVSILDVDGLKVNNVFISGSGFTGNSLRALVLNVTSNNLVLANGYAVSEEGAAVLNPTLTFFTSSAGNSIGFPGDTVTTTNYTFDPIPQFNVTQSYNITTPSLLGNITQIHQSQDEFYNGELSGSVMLITNGELNEGCANFKQPIYKTTEMFGVRIYDEPTYNLNEFLQFENLPLNGYLQIYSGTKETSSFAPPPSTGSSPTPPLSTKNTPVSFVIQNVLNSTTQSIGFYNSPTTDFKWLWNEGINNGGTVDISSSLGTSGYTRLIPINQFSESIYNFDLNNVSVAMANGIDISSEWTITKEGGGTISDPNKIKFVRNADAQPFKGALSYASAENITLNFKITSSATTAGTDTNGSASFSIKPAIDTKHPYTISGATASLYNRVPTYNIDGNNVFSLNSTLSSQTFAGNSDVYSNGVTQKSFTNGSSSTKSSILGGVPLFRNGVGSDWNDGSIQSLEGLRFITGGGNATRGGSGVTAWAVADSTYNSVNYFNIGMASNGALEIGYDGTNQGGINFYWVYFYVQDATGNVGNFTIPKTLFPYTPSDYKIFAIKVRVS